MLPNFLVIGSPKAATTSLCHNLGQHPEIFFSTPKEPFFFSDDTIYARGLDWYEEIFREAGTARAVGEGSTTYSVDAVYPNTVGRIAATLPEAKIIYQVRDPLERMRSHWVEVAAQGKTILSFDQAIHEVPEIVEASRYMKQINCYRQYYSDDRILILFYEDYRKDADQNLAKCFEFLGVDPSFRIAGSERARHTSQSRRSDRPLTNWLRSHVPGFSKLRNHVPVGARNFAKTLLKKPIDGKPDWKLRDRTWARNQIQDDARAFLNFAGKSADYWDLDGTSG